MNSDISTYGCSITLELNKTETFDERKYFLAVCTWKYASEQYLNLSQMRKTFSSLRLNNKLVSKFSFLKYTVVVWGFF